MEESVFAVWIRANVTAKASHINLKAYLMSVNTNKDYPNTNLKRHANGDHNIEMV